MQLALVALLAATLDPAGRLPAAVAEPRVIRLAEGAADVFGTAARGAGILSSYNRKYC
jgi:hypothetical protein